MAYQSRDVLEAMQQDPACRWPCSRSTAARRQRLLMQFQADVLGVDVQRPVVQETTALGAVFAGLAVGFWKDQEDVRHNWALDRQFKPAMAADKRQQLYIALEEGGRPLARLGRLIAPVSQRRERTARDTALRRRFVAGTDGSPTTA